MDLVKVSAGFSWWQDENSWPLDDDVVATLLCSSSHSPTRALPRPITPHHPLPCTPPHSPARSPPCGQRFLPADAGEPDGGSTDDIGDGETMPLRLQQSPSIPRAAASPLDSGDPILSMLRSAPMYSPPRWYPALPDQSGGSLEYGSRWWSFPIPVQSSSPRALSLRQSWSSVGYDMDMLWSHMGLLPHR